jgi:hypothetical protein
MSDDDDGDDGKEKRQNESSEATHDAEGNMKVIVYTIHESR